MNSDPSKSDTFDDIDAKARGEDISQIVSLESLVQVSSIHTQRLCERCCEPLDRSDDPRGQNRSANASSRSCCMCRPFF